MRRTAIWLLPSLVFVALMIVTGLVAYQQVQHQHDLALSYAECMAQHAARPETLEQSPWRAALPVAGLGLFLSLGVFHMMSLLLRRIAMAQEARDQALAAERHSAALPRQILRAQEEERERVARELHDELGQLLTALRLELGVLQKRAEEGLGGQDATLDNVIHIVEQGGIEVRRLCRGLRPPLLDDLGLEPAARLLVREFGEHSGLPVQVHIALSRDVRLSPELKLTSYRIMQEALNNIAKHAEAKGVIIELVIHQERLRLRVEDDGKGFSTGATSESPGVGLAGMSQRATLVDGELTINARPGAGTRILFEAPVARTKSEAAP